MVEWWFLLGVGLVLLTLYEICIAETDTLLIFDYLWFDVSRWEHPIIYWAIIVIQMLMGLALCFLGWDSA